MVGLGNGHIRKHLTKIGEPQKYSWGTEKKKKKKSTAIAAKTRLNETANRPHMFCFTCICLSEVADTFSFKQTERGGFMYASNILNLNPVQAIIPL